MDDPISKLVYSVWKKDFQTERPGQFIWSQLTSSNWCVCSRSKTNQRVLHLLEKSQNNDHRALLEFCGSLARSLRLKKTVILWHRKWRTNSKAHRLHPLKWKAARLVTQNQSIWNQKGNTIKQGRKSNPTQKASLPYRSARELMWKL